MSEREQESKYIMIQLGDEEYAIGIRQVRSIEHVMELTAVPDSSDDVMGIIHLRGEVVPVIDLHKRLSVPSSNMPDSQQRLVIAIINGTNIGLLVDSASEVLDIPENAIQPAPALLQSNSEYITGVARVENRLALILDIAKLTDLEEVEQLTVLANQ